MSQGMIRYLKQEEKKSIRPMYEENFPEDEREFVDYYFAEKTKDNQIIVMEEDTIQVMMHLNPYIFFACKELINVNYVVAVATDMTVRKQGKMAQVMKHALQDMARAHQPFTFLIPANPQVYESTGFVFVPSENYMPYKEALKVKEEAALYAAELATEKFSLRTATKRDIPQIISFVNKQLMQEYDMFVWRTEAYYERIMAELASQDGELVVIEQGRRLMGVFTYGKEETQVGVQEIILDPDKKDFLQKLVLSYVKNYSVEILEMEYMVRILDLQRLGLLLRSEEPFSLKVQVLDGIIAANCGCFEININKNGSTITAISADEVEHTMDISELAKYLFGKMKLFIREWV